MAQPRQEFSEFYQAVFGRLVGQLVLVVGNLHEAEDVAQEALARAAARWSRLRVGGQDVAGLNSPLPTSGNFDTGVAFATQQGRMRAVLGILTPGASGGGPQDPGRAARFRVRYGDAGGTPTSAAETVVIPVGVLHARIWVAFIPADAWLVDIDPLDAQGDPLVHQRMSSCSTPPKLPVRTCPPRTLPPTSRP